MGAEAGGCAWCLTTSAVNPGRRTYEASHGCSFAERGAIVANVAPTHPAAQSGKHPRIDATTSFGPARPRPRRGRTRRRCPEHLRPHRHQATAPAVPRADRSDAAVVHRADGVGAECQLT